LKTIETQRSTSTIHRPPLLLENRIIFRVSVKVCAFCRWMRRKHNLYKAENLIFCRNTYSLTDRCWSCVIRVTFVDLKLPPSLHFWKFLLWLLFW
jgi:hypothetical protein